MIDIDNLTAADATSIKTWQAINSRAHEQYLRAAPIVGEPLRELVGLSAARAGEIQVGWITREQLAEHGLDTAAAGGWAFQMRDHNTCMVGCAVMLPDGAVHLLHDSDQGGLFLLQHQGAGRVLLVDSLLVTLQATAANTEFNVIGCHDAHAAMPQIIGLVQSLKAQEVEMIGAWTAEGLDLLRQSVPSKHFTHWGDVTAPAVQRMIKQ